MDILKNLKKLYHHIDGILFVIKNRKLAIEQAQAESYYPELKRKPYLRRKKENLLWLKKYHEVNIFYTLYGLDTEEFCVEDFQDYKFFMTSRNKKNKWGKIDSQISLLRDKYLFFKYMNSCLINVPEVFAISINGNIFDKNFNLLKEEFFINKKDYFIKDSSGECASFVKHVSNYEEFRQLKNSILKGNYIFQNRIEQCFQLKRLNPYGVNTLRIVTVNVNGTISVLSSILRCGTKKTDFVDNWAKGGLAIGINKDGTLKKYGFYKPIYGKKTDIHPDTNIKFENFKIPYYKEAIELANQAHKLFYNISTIGWDVAITEEGPIFIEGNDNWEISLMQACDRGLRKEWNKIIKE